MKRILFLIFIYILSACSKTPVQTQVDKASTVSSVQQEAQASVQSTNTENSWGIIQAVVQTKTKVPEQLSAQIPVDGTTAKKTQSPSVSVTWGIKVQAPVLTQEESLKKRLTPLQYEVTQNGATEKPFKNEYWDNHEKWIYVDIVSGKALFSSTDKYDSGTGWPTFSKPINWSAVVTKNDYSILGIERTEVLWASSKSHVGHVFSDGPQDKWGLRYCTNSAALIFIPFADLEKRWYKAYTYLFQ